MDRGDFFFAGMKKANHLPVNDTSQPEELMAQ